jgi:hypothetical protein
MAIESQSTTVEIGTGSGGAKTITDISLANPTILTSAAHGLSNGDVVTAALFAGADAASINALSWVVKYVTTDTFAIELDSTSLTIDDNSNTATMTPVTWTTIGEVTDFSGPDGSASEIDVSHLTSTSKEFIMGLPDEGSLSLSVNWDTSDSGQDACATARAARTEEDFKITYSDASTATFTGYVTGMSSSGGVDGKVSGSISIRITDSITWA